MDTFTEEIDGWTIKIEPDTYPENPREIADDTVMVCFCKRYSLGDEHDYDMKDYYSWDELKQAIVKNENPAVCLPLYLYDHSGITISTTPFGDRWDSGQVGWIFKRREDVLKDYGVKRISKKVIESITNGLIGEVELYDQYLTGNIYMFTIYDNEGDVESCGSWFYGFEECKKAAEEYILEKRNYNDNRSQED